MRDCLAWAFLRIDIWYNERAVRPSGCQVMTGIDCLEDKTLFQGGVEDT
jgi:hypothetical protein